MKKILAIFGSQKEEINRFIEDHVDEKELTPISGYWSYPLVPLEQALELIVPHIYQLDRSIKEAKKRCRYPSDHGLTRDESAALFLYTMEGGENSFYRALNRILRQEDRSKIKPWFAYLKLFHTALNKLPTVKGCIWRVVSIKVIKHYQETEQLTWWNVSSCSSSVNVVEGFLSADKNSTLFMIEAINGKDLAGYTNYPNEKEVILGVGTQLCVKSNALKHGSLHVVHLKEVDDNSPEPLPSSMTTVHMMPELSNKSPIGDLVCVWEDNFDWNGSVDHNKWDFDVGGSGWGNNQEQYYTENQAQNARCEVFPDSRNGRLIIEACKENYNNRRFTSARLKSKASWTYGRLQIRALLPSGRGLWPALFLLPEKQTYSYTYWPDNGEIDLMVQVGYDPLCVRSGVHTQAYNAMLNNQPNNAVIVSDATTNFKVYTLDWNVDKIEMFVGDEDNPLQTRILIWKKQGNWTQWPFDQPFFVTLNLAVGGTWGGAKGIDENIFPCRMEIDWVRYYQRRRDVHGGASTAATTVVSPSLFCSDPARQW